MSGWQAWVSRAKILAWAMREPFNFALLSETEWTGVIAVARAELLLGTVAHLVQDEELTDLPDAVYAILDEARVQAEHQRRAALWEADCAARALTNYKGKVVLMKGTAYVAANLTAGQGRSIGDLDIMVAEGGLREAEAMLLAAGWEWVKEDDYDDAYYRDHMHELPPLIHKERDRMIDVHHTILPRTAKPNPDAVAMLDAARQVDGGLYVFAPEDMAIHCVAHLIADGDLAGGMRNLWDFHCLATEFAERDPQYWDRLKARSLDHELLPAVERAARLARDLYGTATPADWPQWHRQDKWYVARITARDGWGRKTRKFIRLIFYIRSHWLRMPPMMLARHLWTKWRKGQANV